MAEALDGCRQEIAALRAGRRDQEDRRQALKREHTELKREIAALMRDRGESSPDAVVVRDPRLHAAVAPNASPR